MFVRLALATILLVAGCGSSGEPAGSEPRVERCAERFLARTESETAEIRGYVERAYCVPFDRRGWVYDDGTLKIEAHTESGSELCAQAEAGEGAHTVPCEELEAVESPRVLDCALLHLVRKDEVMAYLEKVRRDHEVRCDDETPLDDLGAR